MPIRVVKCDGGAWSSGNSNFCKIGGTVIEAERNGKVVGFKGSVEVASAVMRNKCYANINVSDAKTVFNCET